jgi:fibrillarin-like rRNA methylase
MAMLFEAEIEREFAELARQRERLHAILSDADETA